MCEIMTKRQKKKTKKTKKKTAEYPYANVFAELFRPNIFLSEISLIISSNTFHQT